MSDDSTSPPASGAMPLDQETQARAAGYDWSQIDDHVNQSSMDAHQAGYGQQEIDGYLGYQPQNWMKDRLQQQWAMHQKLNPDTLTDLTLPEPKLDLTMPTYRSDYANALLNSEVRGPQDFAEHYSAAALSAAHDTHGLDADPNQVQARQAFGQASADALSAQLPTRRDLIDATLSLSHPDEDGQPAYLQTRQNLMDHWVKTGQHPLAAALQAQQDPGLASRLTQVASAVFHAPQTTFDYWLRSLSYDEHQTFMNALMNPESEPPITGEELFNGFAALMDFVSAGGVGVGSLDMPDLPGADAVKLIERVAKVSGKSISDIIGSVGETLVDRIDLSKPPGEAVTQVPLAEATQGQGGFGRRATEILQGGRRIQNPIIAYHASPHVFSKFDISKIGTGEGQQTEGHGLQFAGSQAVHARYMNQFSSITGSADRTDRLIQLIDKAGRDENGNINTGSLSQKEQAEYDQLLNPPAATSYRAALHVYPHELLNLEEPLAGQAAGGKLDALGVEPEEGQTGEDLLRTLERRHGLQGAADLLHQNGIMGTQALDHSYGMPGDEPNYVLFHHNAILILDRNGVPIEPTPAENVLRYADEFPGQRLTDVAKKQGADAATQELAQGQDAANGLGAVLRSIAPRTFARMMADTSGTLSINPTTNLAYHAGQDEAERVLRGSAANYSQMIAYVDNQLNQLRKTVAPYMPEWERELDLHDSNGKFIGAPEDTAIGKMLSYIEGGPGTLDPNHPLVPVANTLRDMFNLSHKWISQAAAEGTNVELSYRKNYFRHLWADPNEADMWVNGNSKYGSSATWRDRTVETTADGLQAGLRPRADLRNPLDLALASISGQLHHVEGLENLKDVGERNWAYPVMPGAHPNDGDIPLVGPGTNKQIAWVDKATGEVRPGNIQYYGRPGFAQRWNRWYSKPWWSPQTDQFANYALNASKGIALINPTYHLVTLAKEVATGGFINAMHELEGGEVGRAAVDFLKAPYNQIAKGLELHNKYVNMIPDPRLKAILQANPNFFAGRQNIYKIGGRHNYMTAAMRGELLNDMRANWRRVVDLSERDEAGKVVPRVWLRNIPKALANEAGAAMTSITAPVFDYLVPLLKLGATAENAETFLRQHPNATPQQSWRAMQQFVDNADDREGEMNLDNTFWSRGFRQAISKVALSSGWTYGTARQTYRALPKFRDGGWNWDRTAFYGLTGMVAINTISNLVHQWFATGQMPTDISWRHMFGYQSTGQARYGNGWEWDVDPGQMKEFLDLGHTIADVASSAQFGGIGPAIESGISDTAGYLANKVVPVWRMLYHFGTGEDHGKQIAYQPGGIAREFFTGTEPIFLSQQQNTNSKSTLTPFDYAMGTHEGPSWFENPTEWWAYRQGQINKWTREGLRGGLRGGNIGGW